MILGETDEAAEDALARRDKQAPFPVRDPLRDALLDADVTRNIAGERRANRSAACCRSASAAGPIASSNRSGAAAS